MYLRKCPSRLVIRTKWSDPTAHYMVYHTPLHRFCSQLCSTMKLYSDIPHVTYSYARGHLILIIFRIRFNMTLRIHRDSLYKLIVIPVNKAFFVKWQQQFPHSLPPCDSCFSKGFKDLKIKMKQWRFKFANQQI